MNMNRPLTMSEINEIDDIASEDNIVKHYEPMTDNILNEETYNNNLWIDRRDYFDDGFFKKLKTYPNSHITDSLMLRDYRYVDYISGKSLQECIKYNIKQEVPVTELNAWKLMSGSNGFAPIKLIKSNFRVFLKSKVKLNKKARQGVKNVLKRFDKFDDNQWTKQAYNPQLDLKINQFNGTHIHTATFDSPIPKLDKLTKVIDSITKKVSEFKNIVINVCSDRDKKIELAPTKGQFREADDVFSNLINDLQRTYGQLVSTYNPALIQIRHRNKIIKQLKWLANNCVRCQKDISKNKSKIRKTN